MKLIPYGKHNLKKSDLKLYEKIKKTDVLTEGIYLKKFETKVNKFLNTKYGCAVNNGSSALDLAFKAINLNKHDNIIMPAVNFIASFNMAKISNAKIFLADIDKATGQISPSTIEKCIKINKLKKIKAFVTMYLGGNVEQIEGFFKLKKKYRCFFIEDACHAFGAKYQFKNKIFKVGCCKHADLSAFSFHPVKTITTGEGGYLSANSSILIKKINILKRNGILKNSQMHWKYNAIEHGHNYKISEINCILGIEQIKRINIFLNKRIKIFNFYNKLFKKYNLPLKQLKISSPKLSSHHLLIVYIKFNNKLSKNNFFEKMLKKKIFVQQHYIPINRFSIFKKYNYNKEKLINSNYYYKNAVSLPIYSELKLETIKFIVKEIKNITSYAKIKSI